MNYTIVQLRELYNDGSIVYIYYNKVVGAYVAYGISAFNASRLICSRLSYSEDMLMPVAYFDKESLKTLKKKYTVVKELSDSCELRTQIPCDDRNYQEWVEKLRLVP